MTYKDLLWMQACSSNTEALFLRQTPPVLSLPRGKTTCVILQLILVSKASADRRRPALTLRPIVRPVFKPNICYCVELNVPFSLLIFIIVLR